jgi:hypothetical protein
MRKTVTGMLAASILLWAATAAARPAETDAVPPAGAAAAAEPGAPPAAPPAAPAAAGTAAPTGVTYAVGTRLRGLFVPAWFLQAFMTHAHPLNSFSWGVDFTRRKGNLDMVIGMDVGWYGNFKKANWTGNDESSYPGDTYWTEFKGFVFTSFDINWMWNQPLTEWLAFRAGGGVGIGFLAGDYYKTQSGPNCTAANVDRDLSQCGPIGTRKKEDLKYYRVLPVVSALLGFRFNLHRHFMATVEGGFHNGFVAGASAQYVF